MKSPLQTISSVLCFLCLSEHVLSSPIPRPRPKALHEVHVDLIDTIFQIPIQTLNGVANLLKNVHNKKRNFISINVHVGKHPEPSYVKPTSNRPDSYPTKPESYPKPDTYPSNPVETPSGFPDYQPDYTPVLSGSTSRPFSVNVPEDSKPPNSESSESFSSNEPSTSGVNPGLITDSQGTTLSLEESVSGYNPLSEQTVPFRPEEPASKPSKETVAPPSGTIPYRPNSVATYRPIEQTVFPMEQTTYRPVEQFSSRPSQETVPYKPTEQKPASGYKPQNPSFRPETTNKPFVSSIAPKKSYKPNPTAAPSPLKPLDSEFERIPPAPAVQPPYNRPSVAQPLSIEESLNFDKPSNREKNFKEYVQRKLAEKNLQDNGISNTL